MKAEQPGGFPPEMRVLIAEDCPDSRALISMYLETEGMDVECASDGAECLESAIEAFENKAPFDVVVVDVQMPVLDGHATARELRARGYELPILSMTALSSESAVEKSLMSGCDGHVSKLDGVSSLIKALKEVHTPQKREISLPVLPVVPKLVSTNRLVGEQVLSRIEKLETTVEKIRELIKTHELSEVYECTCALGEFSLYGYKLFGSCLKDLQIAAAEEDLTRVKRCFREFERACEGIVAGVPIIEQYLERETTDPVNIV